MKKKQNKAKVEVVEPKSVANKCDYCRTNGKCGRALSEMFGKICPGRSCEDWRCDAEEDEEVKVKGEGEQRKTISRCDGMRKDGTCGNGCSENHNNKCRGVKCPDRFNYGDAEETAVVSANTSRRDGGGTEVAVVEPKGGTVGMTEQDIAAGITRQLQVIEDAEKNAQFERVKLGVVLIRWEQYLGEGRGRGKSGGGLKGWLEANVPALSYDAAQSYKNQAKKAVEMLGGGAKAQAVLLDEPTVTQPDGEVIEIEADYVAKRDKIFEDVKSRRQLEQTYFKFMAHEGKGRQGGANKGQSGTGRRALTVEEQAKSAADEFRELIGSLHAYVVEQKKVALLTAEEQEEFIGNLKLITRSAEEMVG